MQGDDVFRLVLIVGFALVFPFSLYYRLKSRVPKERLNRREEGLFILLTLRPVALSSMFVILAYLINPSWIAWSSVRLPLWMRWCGVGLGITAATLLIYVYRSLGPNLTDTVVIRVNHTLVTSGPYRWVRHPFYVAAALALGADSLLIANWFLALTGGATFGLLVLRTRIEEEKLVDRFGVEYTTYMKRTGRFFPRLRRG